jgi:hypothetical protein
VRHHSKIALAVAALGFALSSPQQAQALDGDLFHRPTSASDPYAYHYEPRGYYPYYNSGYWKRHGEVPLKRAHFKHPKFYQAWGAKRKHWDHVKWHNDHHGRHDHAHW